MNCGDPVPMTAEVTIHSTAGSSKRQQQDVLMMSSLSDHFSRQLSCSTSPLVTESQMASDEHFQDDPQHFDVNHQNDEPAAEKSVHYSDDEEVDDHDDHEEDALVRAARLSRRHSSAGSIPTSLTASSVVPGRGLVRERSTPTRRCRIEEEGQQQQSAASPRPAGIINNNIGNWLNVPGAAVDMANSKSREISKNNVFELVPTPTKRNKTPWAPVATSPTAGRRLKQNNSLGIHLQSTSHHVRSQSVRVAPRSAATSSNRNNNISSSSINQQKLFCDYNSFQQHQQAIKVRPRGTSLPGTNRVQADPVVPTAEQQHYCATTNQHKAGGEDDEADYYLLRHFIVHGKSNKVVNRGDSFRRSLRSHKQQQSTSSAISQHSSTSSISTENVAGSPPPTQQHNQQQQGQYYSSGSYQCCSSVDQVQQHPLLLPSSTSRRASLSLLTTDADQTQQHLLTAGGPSPPAGGAYSLGTATAEPFRVLMLGASGVGKTALTAQFMTSEYLNTYEASLDEDACDRSVSVLLDGEESQLIFIDHPHGEISVENCVATYNPHAYVIVYSVVDAESLRQVEEILHYLWRHSLTNNSNSSSAASPYCRHNAVALAVDDPQSSVTNSRTSPLQMLPPPIVILVANKIDLVRSRIISPQAGKSLATSFDCKYIETSSGMQHNVDELLVGILKQIRLKIEKTEQQIQLLMSSPNSSSSRSLFRKRSGRRRQQQQQQHRVNYQGGSAATVEAEGSCCISTSAGGAYRTSNRRSASLRVRRMLGKAVWTCAEYYHRNKSRSCEDLHVL